MRDCGVHFLKIYPALAGPRCGGANFKKAHALRRLVWLQMTIRYKRSNYFKIKCRIQSRSRSKFLLLTNKYTRAIIL